MPERQYVTVNGKQYPLKTEAERNTPQSSSVAEHPTTRTVNVNAPTPRTGNRTVTLALLVSFGIYALAGSKGVSKLQRLQGYLQNAPQAEQSNTQAKFESGTGTGQGIDTVGVFTPKALFAWMMLFVILQILADFDATSELAGAMAMLIMFTSLIALGPDAFANATSLI